MGFCSELIDKKILFLYSSDSFGYVWLLFFWTNICNMYVSVLVCMSINDMYATFEDLKKNVYHHEDISH